MSQALLDTLINQDGAALLTAKTLTAYLADGSDKVTVLFFTGDPEKKAETADVAVVVRELVRGHADRLRLALVAREDEAALMEEHGVTTLPSLAFFDGPKHLETIARIQNWSVYEEKLPHILARSSQGRAA